MEHRWKLGYAGVMQGIQEFKLEHETCSKLAASNPRCLVANSSATTADQKHVQKPDNLEEYFSKLLLPGIVTSWLPGPPNRKDPKA